MDFFDTNLGIFIIIVAQCLAVTVALLVSLAFLLYMDRKVWAAVQLRRGPNVVRPYCESGLLDISWRAASSGEASDVCLRARSAFACRACASEQFNNLAVFNCFQCNLCV